MIRAAGKGRFAQRAAHFGVGLIGFVIVIAIWQILVTATNVGLVIPSPLEVVRRLIEVLYTPIGTQYPITIHLLISLKRVLIGYVIASVAGILVGIGMGTFGVFHALVGPVFEIVRPIPSVAWIPLAIVWFGIGEEAKIFIITMAAFVQIAANSYTGARRVDTNLIGVAKMLGASDIQTFLKVILPSCVPYVVAGLQIGLSAAWMSILAAEMIAATAGVGWVISAGQSASDMTQIFVGIIVIAFTGMFLSWVLSLLEKILCRWKVRGS